MSSLESDGYGHHISFNFTDYGKKLDRDIHMPDGRHLKLWGNIGDNTFIPEFTPAYAQNQREIFSCLARQNVVEQPEIPAVDNSGRVHAEWVATFFDKRLGAATIVDMLDYLTKYDARLSVWPAQQELIPPDELAKLVDCGITEQGIDKKLAAMRAEDAERAASQPDYDLTHLMGKFNRGEL